MAKVLTSPSSFGEIDPKPFDILKENGYEVINNPFGRKLTEDEVIEIAKECVGIVAGVEPLNQKVMDNLPNLRCISRVGVGMDSVDLDYAKQKGIVVTNTPDGPTRSVAELTIAMTLALLRKVPQAHMNIKQGVWKKEIGNLMYEKKVGLIGLGKIGKLAASQFQAFGCSVMAFDLYPETAWAEANDVEIVDMEKLLAESDIISLHIPKPDTELIGAAELESMKEGSFLINIARDGIVNEGALYEALKSNKLAGAAIDVFSKEPYDGSLKELDNIVLTPHIGSYAKEGKLQMEIDAVNNLLNALSS
ncbi:D-isomer specific 2-hydroxyacid dehydrogenase NAD-binding [Chlorobium limicola DSM 245]|uniref:D-isomer specific 2-hydroxyacid dehydrogenase NAD-binding n=1 Tax=Chlorobium limicola (strain DSM 245 / NBRC 103803 / 6330) TaxID=290315 RepID=B3EF68_CHLL2|nr:phosphoglycerate dehydrogenase [Chlorobium limicola]ACD90930.1 D-isomer specific 2-hydroxyacid dehydrogenase NAD-binding [Chlorobium limicola DSM 245]